MTAFAGEKGRSVKKAYFFYTTCPKCAKIYGKNYVVGVVRSHRRASRKGIVNG